MKEPRKHKLCAYFQRYRIMERRQGMVYNTELLYGAWFPMGSGPELNKEDENGEFWCATVGQLEWRNDYKV